LRYKQTKQNDSVQQKGIADHEWGLNTEMWGEIPICGMKIH